MHVIDLSNETQITEPHPLTCRPLSHKLSRPAIPTADLAPTAKRVAGYMLANLEQLGLETTDQIAQQTATSGISVGRFLRSIGYRNLDDLKRELRGALTCSFQFEIEAIRHVYQLAQSPMFACIAQRISNADAVYILGIHLLQVKTDVGQFWNSLVPLTCLFNLLFTAIVTQLGSAIDERVARNRELQGGFDQFDL
jgi:DNA-binding MurR/RpiR family transcriptional regulator